MLGWQTRKGIVQDGLTLEMDIQLLIQGYYCDKALKGWCSIHKIFLCYYVCSKKSYWNSVLMGIWLVWGSDTDLDGKYKLETMSSIGPGFHFEGASSVELYPDSLDFISHAYAVSLRFRFCDNRERTRLHFQQMAYQIIPAH